jgi:hypothetical protein
MSNIRFENGIVHAQINGINLTLSNLKEFSEAIIKIKRNFYDNDERSDMIKKVNAIDMLCSARLKFIKYQEQQCIKNLLSIQ